MVILPTSSEAAGHAQQKFDSLLKDTIDSTCSDDNSAEVEAIANIALVQSEDSKDWKELVELAHRTTDPEVRQVLEPLLEERG